MTDRSDEALHLRKQAEVNAESGQFLLASIFVSQAIKAYTKLNDGKVLQELKYLSIEYRKKADKEYKQVGFSVQLSRQEVEKVVNHFSRYKHASKNLAAVARDRMFLQDFQSIEQFARDNVPVSAILASHSVTDQNGHLISDDDFDNYWLAKQYGIWQDYSTRILTLILHKMRTEGKLSPSALGNYFRKGRHYTSDERRKLSIVFDALERDDFISILHILVPTFETVFMRTSGQLGIDTVALGRGNPMTNQRTLSSTLLLSDDFINIWGVDFCHQIDFVLFTRYGFGLRHKIAHGSIRTVECNMYTFSAVFYLYLRLMAMVTVTPNQPREK